MGEWLEQEERDVLYSFVGDMECLEVFIRRESEQTWKVSLVADGKKD